MTDFNRHTIPPSGWVFRQPQTGWSAPSPVAFTFDQQVLNIVKHRLANKAICQKYNLATNPEAVAQELENYTRARLGLSGAAPAPFPVSRSRSPASSVVAAAVTKIKQIGEGVSLLMEWDQSGVPPAPHDLAERRATVCSTCPKNEKNVNLSDWFTIPAANLIKKQFERLHQLNLSTSHDNDLNVCSGCLCPLKLKVHTPIALITKRIKPEQKAQLDPRCWILSEGQ